jgi:phosphoglycerate kinase
MTDILSICDLSLKGKRVLIREDLNVPLHEGIITSDARLRAALPSIQQALAAGAAVIVMSHLGRPEEGQFDPRLSLQPVALYLSEALGQVVPVVTLDESLEVKPGAMRTARKCSF